MHAFELAAKVRISASSDRNNLISQWAFQTRSGCEVSGKIVNHKANAGIRCDGPLERSRGISRDEATPGRSCVFK